MRRYFSLTLQCNAPYLKTLIGNGVAAAAVAAAIQCSKTVNDHPSPLYHHHPPTAAIQPPIASNLSEDVIFINFVLPRVTIITTIIIHCVCVCLCVKHCITKMVHIKGVLKLKMQKSITCVRTDQAGNTNVRGRLRPYHIWYKSKVREHHYWVKPFPPSQPTL